jgi:tRNA G46 methylase TrmB
METVPTTEPEQPDAALRAEVAMYEDTLRSLNDAGVELDREHEAEIATLRADLARKDSALREIYLEAGFGMGSFESAQASRLAIREEADAALAPAPSVPQGGG